MPRPARRAPVVRPLKFDQKLILAQWIFDLFEVRDFTTLADWLRDPSYEGFDENNISHYYHVLIARLIQPKALPADLLLTYDQNIVRHWKRITEKRNRQGNHLYPKYFQYLSLLFTEIYLDRYFGDPEKLLADLNDKVSAFNAQNEEPNQVDLYKAEELNKLAYWMATGSGKPLLMHINIIQYQN